MLCGIMERLFIQVTGQPAAGKSEVCKYLSETHGFAVASVGKIIETYAALNGVELRERKDYKTAHEQLQAELGKYAIVRSIVDTPAALVCVDGMRVPAYADKLPEYGYSRTLALQCPDIVRFARSLLREDPLDKLFLEDFLHDEEQEARSTDPFAQSTLTVMEAADYTINSFRPRNEVNREVSAIVEPLIAQLQPAGA